MKKKQNRNERVHVFGFGIYRDKRYSRPQVGKDGCVLSDDRLTLEKVFEIDACGHFTTPEGVTSIGDKAFYNLCSYPHPLTKVTIREGVVKLGMGAFYECEYLRRVEMPQTVTDLGMKAFQLCKNLESMKILGIKNIGQLAFAACKKLHTLYLGKGLVSIGWGALSRCDNLTHIVVDSSDDTDLERIRNLLPEDHRAKVISQAAYNIQQQVASEYAYLAAGLCFNSAVGKFFIKDISEIIASYLPLYRDFILEIINTAGQSECIPNCNSAHIMYRHFLIKKLRDKIAPNIMSTEHANFWMSLSESQGDQKQLEVDPPEVAR